MTVNVAPVPSVGAFQSSVDLTANPLAGGSIQTFAAGTTTPLATYSDPNGTTPNETTIELNNASLPESGGIYLDITLSYKFIWYDAQGVQVDVRDNIAGNPYSANSTYTGGIDIDIIDNIISFDIPATAAEIAASITPVNFNYNPGNILRYGTNTTPGTTDMTAALQSIVNQWSYGGTAGYIPTGIYFQGSSVTIPATTSGKGVEGITGFGLAGDGAGMSIITTSNNIENFSTTGATSSTFLYKPTFKDLAIINTYPVSGTPQVGATFHHIHLENPQQAEIIRCHIKGNFTDVVGSSDNEGGVWFDNQGYGGVYLNEIVDCWINHAHITMDTSDSIVRDSIIWGNGTDYAVKVNNSNIHVINNYDINGLTSTIQHGAIWLTSNAANIIVKGNFFDEDCTYGVWSDGNLMQLIEDNIFWQNSQAAIHMINANSVTINGNGFLNCGTNNTGLLCSDIVFDTQLFCNYCIVSNNSFFRTESTTNAYAIYEYNNGASPTQNRYIGNSIESTSAQYNSPAILIIVSLRNATPGSHAFGNVGSGSETEIYSSFTGTYTGGTTSPTVTCLYSRQMNTVTLTIPSTFYTSNSTGFTITGLPSSIQSSISSQNFPCNVEDNNTQQLGDCQISATSGTITFTLGSGAAWTNSGNRGLIGAFTLTYQLS